jgi:ubiquinone/menaquinone biosynthesis C-methylase UbiE
VTLPGLPRVCEKAERRSSNALAYQTVSRFWTLAVAMARRQYPRQNSERMCLALISRATWLRLGTSGPRSLASLANCRFQEGDAANLHQVPERAFDLVVSIFGAMFAPKPFEVAKETVRVTRPGGRIIMGNWIPNDPTLVAQILKISSAYTPPPPKGFVSPLAWGIESKVIERFAAAGVPAEKISFARDTFTFNYPGPPAALVDEFRKYYGPTMNAFEAAEKNDQAADLQKELEELFNRQNQSPRKQATSIPATFLRVTVAR